MIVVTVDRGKYRGIHQGFRHDFRRIAPALRWVRIWLAQPGVLRVCVYDEPTYGPLHRLFDSQYGLPWEAD